MIPYSRRLMAPQWMLWHVFRYRDGRQQSGNQRGSARDAALNHELSMITTSNITEAAATPTTTTTMMATTTATIRSVSSVPGMLSASVNSEYVAQLRIIHSISHPPQWKEAVLRSRTGEVPHLIVQRSIDCPTWLLQVAAIYQSVHSFEAANIRSFRIRSIIAVPHPYHVDTYSIASIDQELLYFSPYPASEHPPSLPLSTGGRGGGGAGLRRRKRKTKSPDKLPRANSVGRGSRRIERTRSIIVPAILVEGLPLSWWFFPPQSDDHSR